MLAALGRSLGVLDEEDDWKTKDSYILSLDLTEATYSMNHHIMDANYKSMNSIMEEYRPWQVFGDLFKIHERTVLCGELVREGILKEDELEVVQLPVKESKFEIGYREGLNLGFTTSSGSFMGDSLSFLHLTMMLATTVTYATRQTGNREVPFGQSVGDDLIAIDVTKKWCETYLKFIKDLGLKTSKINSVSKRAGTFCEQYVCKLGKDELYKVSKDSRFGDLVFIDITKGSLFSGKSKVKMDGGDPTLGHGRMLARQIAYIPQSERWRAKRATRIFWIRNYRNVTGISYAKPHLPIELGGLGIAVGECDSFDSELMQKNYIPYLKGILKLENQRERWSYMLLLQSIFRVNPKGFQWEGCEEEIVNILQNCEVVHESIKKELPSFITHMEDAAKVRRLLRDESLIYVSELATEVARRDAYLKFWIGEEQSVFVQALPKKVRENHLRTWKYIRKFVEPCYDEDGSLQSFMAIATAIRQDLRGYCVNRDDPAISEAFLGMPSLYLDLTYQFLRDEFNQE